MEYRAIESQYIHTSSFIILYDEISSHHYLLTLTPAALSHHRPKYIFGADETNVMERIKSLDEKDE